MQRNGDDIAPRSSCRLIRAIQYRNGCVHASLSLELIQSTRPQTPVAPSRRSSTADCKRLIEHRLCLFEPATECIATLIFVSRASTQRLSVALINDNALARYRKAAWLELRFRSMGGGSIFTVIGFAFQIPAGLGPSSVLTRQRYRDPAPPIESCDDSASAAFRLVEESVRHKALTANRHRRDIVVNQLSEPPIAACRCVRREACLVAGSVRPRRPPDQ